MLRSRGPSVPQPSPARARGSEQTPLRPHLPWPQRPAGGLRPRGPPALGSLLQVPHPVVAPVMGPVVWGRRLRARVSPGPGDRHRLGGVTRGPLRPSARPGLRPRLFALRSCQLTSGQVLRGPPQGWTGVGSPAAWRLGPRSTAGSRARPAQRGRCRRVSGPRAPPPRPSSFCPSADTRASAALLPPRVTGGAVLRAPPWTCAAEGRLLREAPGCP